MVAYAAQPLPPSPYPHAAHSRAVTTKQQRAKTYGQCSSRHRSDAPRGCATAFPPSVVPLPLHLPTAPPPSRPVHAPTRRPSTDEGRSDTAQVKHPTTVQRGAASTGAAAATHLHTSSTYDCTQFDAIHPSGATTKRPAVLTRQPDDPHLPRPTRGRKKENQKSAAPELLTSPQSPSEKSLDGQPASAARMQ